MDDHLLIRVMSGVCIVCVRRTTLSPIIMVTRYHYIINQHDPDCEG